MKGTTRSDPPVTTALALQVARDAERAAQLAHEAAGTRVMRLRGLVDPHHGAGTRPGGHDVVAVLTASAELPEALRGLALSETAMIRAQKERETLEATENARTLARLTEQRRPLVAEVLRRAEALDAALTLLRGHDAEMARVGSRPDTILPDFASALVFMRARLGRAAAPPTVAPPAPGKVRVQVVERFFDEERVIHYPGDVTDLVEADARAAVEKSWAIEV